MHIKKARSMIVGLAAAIGLASASCGDTATELGGSEPAGIDRVGSNLDLLPDDVLSILLGVTDAIEKGQDLLGEMEPSLGDLAEKIDRLEQRVIDLSLLEKQIEMRAIKREIDSDRQETLVAGLFEMRQFPQEAHSLELSFEGVAEKYFPEDPSLQSWYFFTGVSHDDPSRFDHRLAQSTFVLAVDSWIQAKLTAGEGLGGLAGEKLRQFADALDDNAGRVRSRVTCTRFMVPAGKGHPCRLSYVFHDGIEESSPAGPSAECSTSAETAAHCTTNFQTRRYDPSAINAIAAAWRRISS